MFGIKKVLNRLYGIEEGITDIKVLINELKKIQKENDFLKREIDTLRKENDDLKRADEEKGVSFSQIMNEYLNGANGDGI